MIHQYNGKKYYFEIEFDPYNQIYIFNIVVVHKKSLRWSTINTLNTILSWFEIQQNDKRENDSDWIISNIEYMRFKKFITEIFSDKNAISYLEDKLDEDRTYGEWANRRKNKK